MHSAAITQVIVNFAQEHGVDEETCLHGTGISIDTLRDPGGLIDRTQEMRLFENILLALPDLPALGYELGARFHFNAFGVVGFATASSRNVMEAVERALRFVPLTTAYCQFSAHVQTDELHIRVNPDAIPTHLRQTLLERDICTTIVLLRDLSLQSSASRRLLLRGEPLDYADEIQAITGLKPEFGARENTLVISLAEAMSPLPTYQAHMVELLEDQCRQLMQRREVGGTAGKVRELLLARDGLLRSLEDTASNLCLSPRSLRRHLEAEGSSFRQIQEETRHQLARQLLSGSEMKLVDIAYHLGYTDTSSFTRSFKRWEAISPGEFRKQHTDQ